LAYQRDNNFFNGWIFILALILFINGFFFSIGKAEAVPETGRIQVAVSILPQKFFLEHIGKDLLHVIVMIPPGANPAIYEPKPRQMKLLSNASMYFAIDVPFERAWLERFRTVNPRMKVVHTWKGIERYPMSENGHTRKGEIVDPHIWLSPPLALIQARNMMEALSRQYPEWAETFVSNYEALAKKIVSLDLSIMKMLGLKSLSRGGSRAFMVFHPSWGYFARAYGLRQIPIEQEGKEPKPSQLVRLIRLAKKMAIKAILVQPQFSAKAAKLVSEATGARLIVADPLALDWDDNLLKVARALGECL